MGCDFCLLVCLTHLSMLISSCLLLPAVFYVSPAAPYENGPKDTLISYPGTVTRIVVVFDLPGTYVWHCHILSHEDNMMIRELVVGNGFAVEDYLNPAGKQPPGRNKKVGDKNSFDVWNLHKPIKK